MTMMTISVVDNVVILTAQ